MIPRELQVKGGAFARLMVWLTKYRPRAVRYVQRAGFASIQLGQSRMRITFPVQSPDDPAKSRKTWIFDPQLDTADACIVVDRAEFPDIAEFEVATPVPPATLEASSISLKSFEARRKDPNYDYYNDPQNPWWQPETDIVKANQTIGNRTERVGECMRACNQMAAELAICRAILFRIFALQTSSCHQYFPLGSHLMDAVRLQVERMDGTTQEVHSLQAHQEIVGRLSVIPIPVNIYGQGPETNPEQVAYTEYQLWDELNLHVATTVSPDQAELLVKVYNAALRQGNSDFGGSYEPH